MITERQLGGKTPCAISMIRRGMALAVFSALLASTSDSLVPNSIGAFQACVGACQACSAGRSLHGLEFSAEELVFVHHRGRGHTDLSREY